MPDEMHLGVYPAHFDYTNEQDSGSLLAVTP